MNGTDFDLDGLIEKTREEFGPDPAVIAVEVEKGIPEPDRKAVMQHLLAHYIRKVKPRMSQIRHRSASQPKTAAKAATRKPNRSAKVALLQKHARFLKLGVSVGLRQDKYMADCTYEDLIYAAKRRRTLARADTMAAENFEALAALVNKYEVATVGKLPPSVLDEFLKSLLRAAA